MKRCPQCGREYDLSMSFCLDDGSELLYGPASIDEPATAILPGEIDSGSKTRQQFLTTDQPVLGDKTTASSTASVKPVRFVLLGGNKALVILVAAVLVTGAGGYGGYRWLRGSGSAAPSFESMKIT